MDSLVACHWSQMAYVQELHASRLTLTGSRLVRPDGGAGGVSGFGRAGGTGQAAGAAKGRI